MIAGIIGWLLHFAGAAIGFLGRCFGALWGLGSSLLSAAAEVLTWPFRWGAELLSRLTGLSIFLLPVAALLGLALVFIVLVLVGRFLIVRNEKRR